MRTATKENITGVLLSYFGEDSDPRLLETIQRLAFHHRAFAMEVDLCRKA